MINLIPTHHKYAEKQLVFNVSNSNLDNTISINNFKLSNVYPNPFNQTTTISYDVSNLSNIKISIYNMNVRQSPVVMKFKLVFCSVINYNLFKYMLLYFPYVLVCIIKFIKYSYFG